MRANKFLSRVAERRDREMVDAVLGRSLDEERTMSSCARCGKALRSNNKSGVCSVCQAKGLRTADGPKVQPDGSAEYSGTLKQFHVAARALGLNPDELLAGYARAWLDKVRASVPLPGDEP